MGFSGQEYWGGFPFPSPGTLPDPGIKPTSHVYLYWQVVHVSDRIMGDFFLHMLFPKWLKIKMLRTRYNESHELKNKYTTGYPGGSESAFNV